MRFSPCAKHDGRHMDVWGQCVHWGAPCVLRPGICPEMGCCAPIMRRLDLRSGHVTTIEDGSDDLHVHPAPIKVEIDEEHLASAIVSASRATRQSHAPVPRREPDTIDPQSPLSGYRPVTTRPDQRAPLGGIPEFEV